MPVHAGVPVFLIFLPFQAVPSPGPEGDEDTPSYEVTSTSCSYLLSPSAQSYFLGKPFKKLKIIIQELPNLATPPLYFVQLRSSFMDKSQHFAKCNNTAQTIIFLVSQNESGI